MSINGGRSRRVQETALFTDKVIRRERVIRGYRYDDKFYVIGSKNVVMRVNYTLYIWIHHVLLSVHPLHA